MWAKKTPLDKAAVGGNCGRMYRVVSWALNGRAVCRAAWKAARGGSEREHRNLCKRTLDLSSPTLRPWLVPLALEPYVHARAPHVVVMWVLDGLACCTNPLLCVAVCSVSMICRGYSPEDLKSKKDAKKMLKLLKQSYDIKRIGTTDRRRAPLVRNVSIILLHLP